MLAGSDLALSSVVLSLFDQSDDCIKLIEPDGRLYFMNCKGRQAMEIDDFSAIEGSAWDELWPDESRGLVRSAMEAARSGALNRFEAFCPTVKGTPKWWEVTVSPILDSRGEVSAILSSSRDVTERRQRTEQLDTMAAEMRHRLRNAYAISAAVALTMGRGEPASAEFARNLSDRLMRLAEVQADLLDVGSSGLAQIVERIVRSFAEGSQVAIGALPDVRLDEKQARAIVLVLSEMATNSLKYGSLAGRGTLEISAAEDDGRLLIDWVEVHCDADPADQRGQVSSGAGYELKVRMLATVGGSIDIERGDGGYRARVAMPLRHG